MSSGNGSHMVEENFGIAHFLYGIGEELTDADTALWGRIPNGQGQRNHYWGTVL